MEVGGADRKDKGTAEEGNEETKTEAQVKPQKSVIILVVAYILTAVGLWVLAWTCGTPA